MMMNKMSIKKDDTVVVLSGKDKGKQGKVLKAMPQGGQGHRREASTSCSRHTKPRKQGDEGGIIQKEAAIYACKVHASSAPSATSPPALPQARRTARRSASARSAALKSERGGVKC